MMMQMIQWDTVSIQCTHTSMPIVVYSFSYYLLFFLKYTFHYYYTNTTTKRTNKYVRHKNTIYKIQQTVFFLVLYYQYSWIIEYYTLYTHRCYGLVYWRERERERERERKEGVICSTYMYECVCTMYYIYMYISTIQIICLFLIK